MKRLLLIISLFSLSITTTFAQTDFRKGSWGDSQAEITKKEGQKNILPQQDSYGFEGSVSGKHCIVAYAFMDDKLFRGAYMFTDRFMDHKEYIRDYDYLKELLTMKYKEPAADEKTWTDDTFKDDPEIALMTGSVTYSTTWKTKTTIINLNMAKLKGEVLIKIVYDGIELSESHTSKILEDL